MRGPLGLPRGSVRALLALSVVFVTCWLIVRGEDVPLAVSESLFTVLAYYFATRGLAQLSPEERKQLREMRGGLEEDRPLFLPAGTIRAVIILAFVGVSAYLAKQAGIGRLLSQTTLLLVFAFLAGQLLKLITAAVKRRQPAEGVTAFEHGKAAVGVLAGLAFVGLYVSGNQQSVSPQMHRIFLGLIIFYFGSR